MLSSLYPGKSKSFFVPFSFTCACFNDSIFWSAEEVVEAEAEAEDGTIAIAAAAVDAALIVATATDGAAPRVVTDGISPRV